jgi:hypothetical protein
MNTMWRHKWTFISFGITIVHVAVIVGIADFFYYYRGVALDRTPLSSDVATFHVCSILLGAATAVVALATDHSIFAVISLFAAFFSYFFYVG